MPEVSIGFFPDVGACHFLHRLRPPLGLYLGLTGASLSGAAVFLAGAATHYVPSARMPELKAALLGCAGAACTSLADVDALLRLFAAPPSTEESARFEEFYAVAERHFGGAACVSDVARSVAEAAPGCPHSRAMHESLQRCAAR
jgi:enoyl-CoA hydratase/carnithine racemase